MGCKDYFEKCLGRILLYRFEREQYFEMTQMLNKGGEWEGKNMGDVYGAEHLCRLFGRYNSRPLACISRSVQVTNVSLWSVSLPELIAQTNMDGQSISKLKDEIAKLTSWLGKNSDRFFTAEYEDAGPEYTEKTRGS